MPSIAIIGRGRMGTALAAAFREAGAEVTMHWTPGGHAITKEELAAAQEWMVGVEIR